MQKDFEVSELVQRLDALDRELSELRTTPRQIALDLTTVVMVPTVVALSHAPAWIWAGGGAMLAVVRASQMLARRRRVQRLNAQRDHLLEREEGGVEHGLRQT